MVQKRRLARYAAEQEMLRSAADDGVEDRILAVRDRIDLDDFAVGARPVILREFAERTLGLANLRQDAALDHDFCMRGHADPVGPAFDHFDRLAEQGAGDFHFVLVEGRDGLRSENARRMHAYDERNFQRLAGFLGHAEIMQGMSGQEQHTDAVRTADLTAVNRYILNAGLRISSDQERRRDVGSAVVFIVLRDR